MDWEKNGYLGEMQIPLLGDQGQAPIGRLSHNEKTTWISEVSAQGALVPISRAHSIPAQHQKDTFPISTAIWT